MGCEGTICPWELIYLLAGIEIVFYFGQAGKYFFFAGRPAGVEIVFFLASRPAEGSG